MGRLSSPRGLVCRLPVSLPSGNCPKAIPVWLTCNPSDFVKTLNSLGQVVVCPGQTFRTRVPVGVAGRSFVPHYPDFSTYTGDSGTVYVFWTAELKDGVRHRYYYGPFEGVDMSYLFATLCGGFPIRSMTDFYGGLVFNPSVRPFLASKDEVPP